MMEQNTKRLIHRLRSLSNDALVQHLLGILISDIAEAADRLEELSKAQGEPVAWMCPSKCGCLWRDNRDGTMSLFGPNSKSCETWPLSRMIPLYSAPPKRQPLSEDEIKNMWLMPAIYGPDLKKAVALTRAIEKAHGIGGGA